MAVHFKQYTVTASAVNLTSVLGLSQKVLAREIDVKAAKANAGLLYGGGSGVTNVPANAGVALDPGQAFAIVDVAQPGGGLTTDDFYLVGTASDVAYVTVVT